MPTNLFPHIYEELINENIQWLKDNTEECLEQKHIIQILKCSVKEYRERGYAEAMARKS